MDYLERLAQLKQYQSKIKIEHFKYFRQIKKLERKIIMNELEQLEITEMMRKMSDEKYRLK